jgi:phospholipase/carboxylesterase
MEWNGEGYSRREFLAAGVIAGAAACTGRTEAAPAPQTPGHLSARPGAPTAPAPRGETRLGLAGGRDGLLYVPEGYDPLHPAPLLVLLHGAGRSSGEMRAFYDEADAGGVVLVIPDSRRQSWDLMVGGYGPDVDFIDRALTRVFARVAVVPGKLGLGGFSDGASYALSLGLANGDLFTHLIAFSPGLLSPPGSLGRPRVFVSHGTSDHVLRIDYTSRQIVPRLRRGGYAVEYREFEGDHEVPPAIAREAFRWFLAPPAP